MARRYFKRRWADSRGDDRDAWGASDYFFETDEELLPIRQIEVYDGGQRLLYSTDHREDDFGGLASVTLAGWDGEAPEKFEISAAEFEAQWARGPRT